MAHAFFVEDLIPKDHILRRIDAVVDTSWVRAEVAGCYGATGRPSWDPEVIVRMMLLGYLFGFSEVRLCDEVAMHLGYRWFCLLQPSDAVPDRTTLVKLRNERWQQEVWRRILEKTIQACIEAGLVSGRHVAIDGTQVRANAAMGSVEPISPPLPLDEYLLERAGWQKFVPEKDEPPAKDKKDKDDDEPRPAGSADWRGEKVTNATHRSKTDLDALLYRKGNGVGAQLSYLVHIGMDTRSRVALGVRSTQAHTSAEWDAGEALLDDIRAVVGGRLKVVSADQGYGVRRFLEAVVERGLEPHIPVQGRREEQAEPVGRRRRVVSIVSHREATGKLAMLRARNRAVRAMRTRGYRISRKLRLRIEHFFGEGKTCHRLGRARYRGLAKVDQQAVLTVAAMNLKRLAAWVNRRSAAVLVNRVPEPITLSPRGSCQIFLVPSILQHVAP
ncbi:MAG: transposase [Thermoanaerobaculaceae bacterium]|jgi:transposase